MVYRGPSQDEIAQSVSQINENKRSMERIGLFARQCNDLVNLKGLSALPTCDTVVQKFNIDIGKFFAENEAVIESLIYPYTLPLDIQKKLTLNSSKVVGTSDRSVLNEHSNELVGYADKIRDASDNMRWLRKVVFEELFCNIRVYGHKQIAE